jgi:hypothetical protein
MVSVILRNCFTNVQSKKICWQNFVLMSSFCFWIFFFEFLRGCGFLGQYSRVRLVFVLISAKVGAKTYRFFHLAWFLHLSESCIIFSASKFWYFILVHGKFTTNNSPQSKVTAVQFTVNNSPQVQLITGYFTAKHCIAGTVNRKQFHLKTFTTKQFTAEQITAYKLSCAELLDI